MDGWAGGGEGCAWAHHSTASNICSDLVITSSLRHDSMNSSIVMTPSWLRSSFRKTRSICSRAFRSSSTWCARRPISSCTADTTSDSSARLMQPSPFTSYNLNVHRSRSYTEPLSSVDNVTSKSYKNKYSINICHKTWCGGQKVCYVICHINYQCLNRRLRVFKHFFMLSVENLFVLISHGVDGGIVGNKTD